MQNFVIVGTITHTYTDAGSYTITATSTNNSCPTVKQIALGNATVHSCSVPSAHPVQSGTLVAGDHYEGKEEVDNGGKLVSVQDYDGNEYPVVEIGGQCWIAENLRTTHYSNGDAIANGIGSNGSFTHSYYYPNYTGKDLETYGYYYNWYAATRGIPYSDSDNPIIPGICPSGWHVPSNADWNAMLDATQARQGAVKLAKSCDWAVGTDGSNRPGDYTSTVRNAYGFGAIPADWYTFTEATIDGNVAFINGRYGNSLINNVGSRAIFWSSNLDVNSSSAYFLNIAANAPTVELSCNYTNDVVSGVSVRCVRNETSAVPNPIQMSITRSGVEKICDGNPAVITYTAHVNQNGADISDQCYYVWSLDGVTASGVTTKTYTVTITQTRSAAYSVSCTATIPNVGTRSMTNNGLFISTTGNTPGDFTVTPVGNLVTLNDFVEPKPSIISWGDGTVDQSVNNPSSVQHTYNNNGTYTITAYEGWGSCERPKTVTITAPEATLLPTESSVSFCPDGNESVEFNMKITQGEQIVSSGYNCTWSVSRQSGADLDGGATLPNPVPTVSSCAVNFLKEGVYVVSCTASSGTVSLTRTATVTVEHKVAPSFTVSKTGLQVTLENLHYANTITWGDGNSTNEITSETVSHTYASNSTGDGYTITATNTTTNCSKSENVTVAQTPTLISAPVISDITANSMTVTPHFDGATTYTYCISTNLDMSDDTCTEAMATTHTFTELTSNTTYYIQVTATNAGGSTSSDIVSGQTVSSTPTPPQTSCLLSGEGAIAVKSANTSYTSNETGDATHVYKVQDNDGHSYNVVQIGTQCWMAENLRTRKKTNGTMIDFNRSYSNQYAGYYYPGGDTNNVTSYGLLYNRTAAMNGSSTSSSTTIPSGLRGICPEGWHIPSPGEWVAMFKTVNGGTAITPSNSGAGTIAGKLSSGNWTTSDDNNAPGNTNYQYRNSSGFSALPAGYWGTSQSNEFGESARFWTTRDDGNYGYPEYWIYNSDKVYYSSSPRGYAFSIRCLRDY